MASVRYKGIFLSHPPFPTNPDDYDIYVYDDYLWFQTSTKREKLNIVNISDISGADEQGRRKLAVLDIVDNTQVPPTEVAGDRYILDNTGASHADWDGASSNSIVQFNGDTSTWDETIPLEGDTCYVISQSKDVLFTTQWDYRSSSGSFDDSVFNIFNNLDPTKFLNFDVSSISSSTTRTISIPDADIDLSDIILNNTHRSSDGTDHTYIDQDVRTTASPTFVSNSLEYLQLDIASGDPGYGEGRIWYDNVNKALAFYNDETESTAQIPFEQWFRCRNTTGSTLLNGTAVYIGPYNSGLPTVLKASAASATTSDTLVGLLTHDLENNTNGIVVTEGTLRSYDTQTPGWSSGEALWLSTTSGEITNIKPDIPNRAIRIGVVGEVDSVNGTIEVHIGTPITQSSEDIIFPNDGITTHADNLYEVINHIWSSATLDGFDITDNLDGTVDIDEGDIVLRSTNNVDSPLVSYHINATAGITPTDNNHTFIYASYNAGTPVLSTTNDPTTIDGRTEIPIWLITRIGTNIHTVDLRLYSTDIAYRLTKQSFYTDGFMHVPGGSVVTETGTLNLDVTAGLYYIVGLEVQHPAFDTSGIDDFTYIYRDGIGGWTRVTSQTQINNTQYDDGSGTLATVANSKYGVHWVFIVLNDPSELFVMYGRESYATLSDAQADTLPTDLPPELSNYSTGQLIAKVIIQKSASTFSDIQTPFEVQLTSSTASSHNNLGGLQGGQLDEYYHLTATEHSYIDQNVTTTGTPTFSGLTINGNIGITGTVDGRDISDDGTTLDEHSAIIVAQKEPTGFDRDHPTTMGDLSFDSGTLTFAIDVQGGETEYSYYINGVKYVKTVQDTVTITDTEGLWFIYYVGSTLTASQTPWSFGNDTAFVAIVYWDATNNSYTIGEERHGLVMDHDTHEYLHNTVGSAFLSGFAPSLTVDGNGALASHAEMQSISLGEFFDEDIRHYNGVQSTYQIWYKTGANADWRWDAASSALVKMAATYPYYNQFTGGAWQLTECANNSYVLAHIFATNRYGTSDDKVIIILGENNYNSLANAQAGAEIEIYEITTGSLPTPEFIEIGSVIIEIKGTFTNIYNARVISTLEGSDFVDFRTNQKIGIGASVNDHGNLTGLSDDDHTQYALLAGRTGGQTLIGGDAAGDDILIQSTSNATKGFVGLGNLTNGVIYDEVNNRLGIGTNAPSTALDVVGDITVSGTVDGIDIATDVSANTTHRTSDGTDHTYIDQDVRTTASPTFLNISSTNNATANNHVPRWDQVTSLVAGLSWQEPVLDMLTTPPVSPNTGDRYIVTATATGDWTGQENDIAEYNGATWDFTTPTESYTLWVQDIDTNYTFNGSAWVEFGSTVSHNNTTGLQGGTTSEYYHLTSAQHNNLTTGGNSTLHYHSTDRDRSNHTGTQTASTISDFSSAVANNTHAISNHSDVTLTSLAVDNILKWNGTAWVNGNLTSVSGSAGVDFYQATPIINSTGSENDNLVGTLSKDPVTTTEQTVSKTANTNTVILSSWVQSSAMNRTTLDAGVWGFSTYAAVNSISSGRISTITRQIYKAQTESGGVTITITGTGTSRTVTSSGGTPFATTKIDASATNTTASFINTPKGLYQITARTSDTVVTISTPTGYVNESTVAFTTWKKLFGSTSPTITSTGTNYSLWNHQTVQNSFTVLTTDRLASISFFTSNNTTTVTTTYNGSSRNTRFVTPFVTKHNDISGLQGGTTDEYYHLTASRHTDLTDGGDSSLHYHSTDRDRANHTGTQTASTISDFDTEVSNNTDVSSNTTHRTSNGTDHTYIDQDVRTTASPTFVKVIATGQVYSTLPSTLTPSGTTQTVDWDNGNGQVIDLGSATGDVTLTLSNPNAGASYFIKFIQGATARNIVLPSSVLIPGGSAPNTLVLTTTNDAVDTLALFYDGTNYLATLAKDYA